MPRATTHPEGVPPARELPSRRSREGRASREAAWMLAVPALGLLTLACAANPSGTRGELAPETTIVSTEAGRFLLEANPAADTRWERIPAPASEVFRLVRGVYEDLGVPGTSVDTRRMIYGNTSHRVRGDIGGVRTSRFFSCGRAGGLGQDLADAGTLRISVLTQVRTEGPDGARVRTEAVAEVRAGDITSAHRSACASTGLLEAVIAAAVRERWEER
jgi:hypothetical protein